MDRGHRVLRRDSPVVGVETSAGRIDAGAVVVAAGAWSPRICRELGVDLPARPKAIDTVAVTRPAELRPHMVFIDNIPRTYYRTESGQPQAGRRAPPGVGRRSRHARHAGCRRGGGVGAQLLTHRIPAMERATLARGYRAFDRYAGDQHAILGAVDGVDGLYLATAFSGSGFKIAPAVGACMAELIVDGRAKTVDIDGVQPAPVRGGPAGGRAIRTRRGPTIRILPRARRRDVVGGKSRHVGTPCPDVTPPMRRRDPAYQ